MPSDVVIRVNEGCEPEFNLLWNSEWDPLRGVADWALAGADEPYNVGGLAADQTIDTTVVLCLFTDKRVEETHPLFFLCDGDPRGWWGDGVQLDDDDEPMGSLLWLLERAPITIKGMPASQWAILFASEALQILQTQGVCARIDVTATQDNIAGILRLFVKLYARDGTVVFDQQFDLLWNQVAT